MTIILLTICMHIVCFDSVQMFDSALNSVKFSLHTLSINSNSVIAAVVVVRAVAVVIVLY